MGSLHFVLTFFVVNDRNIKIYYEIQFFPFVDIFEESILILNRPIKEL